MIFMILSIGICRIRCSEKYTENRSFVGGATNRNQDLAEWEQAVKNGQKPAEKQHRPPEKQSVRNRLRQLQEENKQNSQPKQRKKSQDRYTVHPAVRTAGRSARQPALRSYIYQSIRKHPARFFSPCRVFF